jgi:hypothetical protein
MALASEAEASTHFDVPSTLEPGFGSIEVVASGIRSGSTAGVPGVSAFNVLIDVGHEGEYSDRARMTRCSSSSMPSEIILDYRTVLHDKANTLELGDVGDGIARDSHNVCEFAGFDGTDALLPAQHLRRVGRNGTNNIKRWHPGIM